MRVRIVRIGNSQGIRIPKSLLEQTGIMSDVELDVEKKRIIIRPTPSSRPGWDDAYKAMAKNGHDEIIDGCDTLACSWDEEEWQW